MKKDQWIIGNSNRSVRVDVHTLRSDMQQLVENIVRYIHTNTNVIRQRAEKLGLTFLNEKVVDDFNICFANSPEVRDDYKTTFVTHDLLNYIYAVFHTSAHREKKDELLKLVFHHMPFPNDSITFWKLVKLGMRLRQINLLEDSEVEKCMQEIEQLITEIDQINTLL